MNKLIRYALTLVTLSFLAISCGQETKPESPSEAFTLQQFEQLIKDNDVVVVDFKADWCGPCKVLGPTLEKVAEDFKGKVKLQKIDVDLSPELATQMGIQGIPYVAKYVKGQKVNEMVGLVPEENVRKFFAE